MNGWATLALTVFVATLGSAGDLRADSTVTPPKARILLYDVKAESGSEKYPLLPRRIYVSYDANRKLWGYIMTDDHSRLAEPTEWLLAGSRVSASAFGLREHGGYELGVNGKWTPTTSPPRLNSVTQENVPVLKTVGPTPGPAPDPDEPPRLPATVP